jgi:hypothetical protein
MLADEHAATGPTRVGVTVGEALSREFASALWATGVQRRIMLGWGIGNTAKIFFVGISAFIAANATFNDQGVMRGYPGTLTVTCS